MKRPDRRADVLSVLLRHYTLRPSPCTPPRCGHWQRYPRPTAVKPVPVRLRFPA